MILQICLKISESVKDTPIFKIRHHRAGASLIDLETRVLARTIRVHFTDYCLHEMGLNEADISRETNSIR